MRKRGPQRKYVYPGVPDEPGYYVYELWAEDACLYVGRVGNSGPGRMYSRLAGHRADKSWWSEVRQIVVSTYGSHEEIAAEEPRRIYELQPLHNQTYAAKCKKGHARDPFADRDTRSQDLRGGRGCAECDREWKASPAAKAWGEAYRQRPEVQRRMSEHWRSAEYKAWREEYRSRPGVQEHEDAYQASYRKQPERIAKEQERARGRDWQEFNARRADKKRRWVASKSRQPSPGQAGLF
jgi:hypothetical protein